MASQRSFGAGRLLPVLLMCLPLAGQAKTVDVDVGGYIAAGADRYGAFYDEEGDDQTTRGVVRNAKLQLELAWGESWEAELDGGYKLKGDDREAKPGDLYLQFSHGSGVIRAGQFKEPFGMERLSGYTSLNTSERSVVTSAFAPGRNAGLLIGRSGRSYTAALGIFTDRPEGGDSHAITGRWTVAPVFSDRQVLHLGFAASYRDLAGERFQIKDEGEVFSADNVIRSPRFDARDTRLAGAELAWASGRLTLASEAMVQEVRRDTGDWWRFSGAYLSAGMFVTDDRRQYEHGEFDRVKPSRATGAVELVARFSHVDLRDRQLGAASSVALLGVHVWYGKHLQMRLNYLWPDIRGNTLMAEPEGQGLTARVVLRF